MSRFGNGPFAAAGVALLTLVPIAGRAQNSPPAPQLGSNAPAVLPAAPAPLPPAHELLVDAPSAIQTYSSFVPNARFASPSVNFFGNRRLLHTDAFPPIRSEQGNPVEGLAKATFRFVERSLNRVHIPFSAKDKGLYFQSFGSVSVGSRFKTATRPTDQPLAPAASPAISPH